MQRAGTRFMEVAVSALREKRNPVLKRQATKLGSANLSLAKARARARLPKDVRQLVFNLCPPPIHSFAKCC